MFNRNCKHYFDLLQVDLVSCIFSSTCFFSIMSLYCHVFDFPLWKKTKTLVYEICKSLDSVFLYIWHNVPTFLWIKYRNMKVCCNSVTVKLSKEDSLNLTLLRRPWACCLLYQKDAWCTNKPLSCFSVFMTVLQLYNNLSDW